MAAYTIPGDFTWTGAITVTGSFSMGSATDFSISVSNDIQMEAGNNARFDSAFGATGGVLIANSNATSFNMGNTSCAIDIASSTYTLNASGDANLHSTTAVDIDAPTTGLGGTSTLVGIGNSGAGVTVVGATLSINAVTNIDFGATVANINMGSITTGIGILGDDITIHGDGDVVVESGSGTQTFGNVFRPTGLFGTTIDSYAQTGDASFQSATVLQLGGALTPTVHLAKDVFTTSLLVGSGSTVITVSADTCSLDTVGTLHLGGGGATTLQSGLSVDLGAPGVNINIAAATNTTTIGNAFAGNNFVVNSTAVDFPNANFAIGSIATPAGDFHVYCGNNSANRIAADLGTSQFIIDSVALRLNSNALGARVTLVGLDVPGNTVYLVPNDTRIPNISSLSGDAAVPATVQPAGYATVILEIATGKLAYYVQ